METCLASKWVVMKGRRKVDEMGDWMDGGMAG
jgi:hypothetical protein